MNTQQSPIPKRRVVDAFTRVLHALMAISFGVAYITSEVDSMRLVHVTMGYTLGALFLLRVAWSAVGPRRVSLLALTKRLSDMKQIPNLIQRHDWQALLKLALGFSMVALLFFTLPVVASGYVAYFEILGEWTEELHESVANIMLMAVSCHVSAVALLRLGQAGYQIRPMLTGCVDGKGVDLVKHNMVSAAVVLLLLVAGFWSWQTYQYLTDPQWLEQPKWLHPEGSQKGKADD